MVPPLPIPNREVKPVHADGTASSGRVGNRPLLINVRKPPAEMARRLSSFCTRCLLFIDPHYHEVDAPSFLFNYVYACWANMYDKYLCFHLIIVLLCARGTGCQTSWGNGQYCFLVLLTLNEI